ncbi:MAG: transcriptional regulatory protein, MerR family [uncultured bacterium]|nr:MAG: transcriptional regulatory protein, MerR family [uncultured bacterium]
MPKNLDGSSGLRFAVNPLDGMPGDVRYFSLAELAEICNVEPEWLQRNLAGGGFPGVELLAGQWQMTGDFVLRARLMRQLERDFKALVVRSGCAVDLGEVAVID